MPQYLLSVWHDGDYSDLDFNSPDMQRIGAQVNEFNATLEKASSWVFGAGLHPASSARAPPWPTTRPEAAARACPPPYASGRRR